MSSVELLEWNEALDKLEEKDAAMAQVVKLRYFAGLTVGRPPRLWTCLPDP